MSKVVDQAKDLIKRYDESGFIHRDATMLLPELVAECERWRAAASKSADMGMELCKDNKWLLSERARLEKIAIEEHASSMYYHFTDTPRSSFSEESEKVKSRYREQAAQELGIATSDHIIPHAGQKFIFTVRCERDSSDHIGEATQLILTAEQREALKAACQIFQSAIDGEGGKPLSEQVMLLIGINSTIGAMLAHSRPAWGITEERQAAIRRAHDEYKILPKDFAVLKAMLEECKQ